MNTPKVSILCSTYNHEKYIGQALESFVAQKTNFDFEVLVHDDASTDDTQSVIKEFEEKYPSIVKSVFQKENQYSRGIRRAITEFLLPIAKGGYILLCNGDDYFTNENKLQIQADFLDKNNEYSMCFHPVETIFEDTGEEGKIYPEIHDGSKFTLNELLRWNFMNTNAAMYRRQDYSGVTKRDIVPGDWYLHIYHARFGKIGFIDRVMAVYRKHEGGIWKNAGRNPDKMLETYGIPHLAMHFETLKLFEGDEKRKEIIYEHIYSRLKRFVDFDRRHKTNMIGKIMVEFRDDLASVPDKFKSALIADNY